MMDVNSWGHKWHKIDIHVNGKLFLCLEFLASPVHPLTHPPFKHRGVATNAAPFIIMQPLTLCGEKHMSQSVLTHNIFQALVINIQGILQAVCRSWSLYKFSLQRNPCTVCQRHDTLHIFSNIFHLVVTSLRDVETFNIRILITARCKMFWGWINHTLNAFIANCIIQLKSIFAVHWILSSSNVLFCALMFGDTPVMESFY